MKFKLLFLTTIFTISFTAFGAQELISRETPLDVSEKFLEELQDFRAQAVSDPAFNREALRTTLDSFLEETNAHRLDIKLREFFEGEENPNLDRVKMAIKLQLHNLRHQEISEILQYARTIDNVSIRVLTDRQDIDCQHSIAQTIEEILDGVTFVVETEDEGLKQYYETVLMQVSTGYPSDDILLREIADLAFGTEDQERCDHFLSLERYVQEAKQGIII